MNKIIFLDRDGVINFEPGDYTYKIEDFKIVDGLFDALLFLKNKGYQFIVITNQGGISKGLYTHNDVKAVHVHMQECFKMSNIDLLDIYFCPHHNVNEKCICRKPDSLLLEKAIARYKIDKSRSYFIGDSKRDVLAAIKAGITGIQIISNNSLKNYLNQIN
jgi:D-glycero-D-manno-heptose 1,7-bisphosphate phosphatase